MCTCSLLKTIKFILDNKQEIFDFSRDLFKPKKKKYIYACTLEIKYSK